MPPANHRPCPVGVGPFSLPSGRRVRAALRNDSTTFGLDDAQALSFDRSGRLMRAFRERRSILRGLDNRFIERRRSGPFLWNLARRELPRAEWHALIDWIHEELLAVQGGIDAGIPEREVGAELQSRVTEILHWTPAALERDAARFRSVYLTVPILPPDQYRAVVVQVTEGCAYNRCAFCDLYRDRPFRVKSLDELRQHIQAVRTFFGEGLPTRRGIFLCDANALALPPAQLLDALALVQGGLCFHDDRPHRICSFVDAFTHMPAREQVRAMAEQGLHRVYLGLETGCDHILTLLNKPALRADAVALVQTLKDGGVAVGVIVLVGLGGVGQAERHVAETLDALQAMPLDGRDIVYLSPLTVSSPFGVRARGEAIRPPTDAEMDAQVRAFTAGIRSRVEGRPKVAVYDIQDFMY